jgi:hypothetical protein
VELSIQSSSSVSTSASTHQSDAIPATKPTREQWQHKINELRTAGKNAEADAAEKQFRVDYPN